MSSFITSSDFVDGVRYHVLINGAPSGPFTKDAILDLHRRAVISEDTRGCIINPHFQPKVPSVASWLPIRTLLPDILDSRHKPDGDAATVIDWPDCDRATAQVEAKHYREESFPSPPSPIPPAPPTILPSVIPSAASRTAVASKEELLAFVQARSYYYLPKWEALDPTLRRITPGPFNWAACFLTVFWMAYRKMYVYVIIWVAFLLVFFSVLPTSVANGASIAIMYLFGRYGTSLYRRHVERKIQQIKTTMAPEYWAQAFRDRGGTSLLAPILLILLYLLTVYGSILEKSRQ